VVEDIPDSLDTGKSASNRNPASGNTASNNKPVVENIPDSLNTRKPRVEPSSGNSSSSSGNSSNSGGDSGQGTNQPGGGPCTADERALFAKMTGTWQTSYGPVTFSGLCENVTGYWMQGQWGGRVRNDATDERGEIKGGRGERQDAHRPIFPVLEQQERKRLLQPVG